MDSWASPWRAAGSLWKDLESSIDKAMGVEEGARKEARPAPVEEEHDQTDAIEVADESGDGGATVVVQEEPMASVPPSSQSSGNASRSRHPTSKHSTPPGSPAPAPANQDTAGATPPAAAAGQEGSFFDMWGLTSVASTLKTMAPVESLLSMDSSPQIVRTAQHEPNDDVMTTTVSVSAEEEPTPSTPHVPAAPVDVHTASRAPVDAGSAPASPTVPRGPDATTVADDEAAPSQLEAAEQVLPPVAHAPAPALAPVPASQPPSPKPEESAPLPAIATPEEHAVEVVLVPATEPATAQSERELALERQLRGREQQVESLSLQAAKALDDVVRLQSALEAAEAKAAKLDKALLAEKAKAGKASKEAAASTKLQDRISELEAELAHRDHQIAEIMKEGETLSKRVGALDNTLKQARATLRTVEGERDAKKEEIAALEARIASMKSRMTDLESEAQYARKDKDTASDVASASQSRLAAAEEEVNKLRLESKAMRASLAAAQREAEESRNLVSKALADAEAAERSQREMEAGIAASRTAEATATRVVAVYEDQLRDLRSQLQHAQETFGQREDEYRREISDLQFRLQRVQSNAEDTSFSALAAAYGITLSAKDAFSSPSPSSPGAPRTPASPGTHVVETLLTQVATLQAELQSKRDAWAASRATLQARIAAAESALDAADQEVKRAEGAAAESSQNAATLRAELMSLRSAKARTDADLSIANDKLRDAEGRLLSLSAAHDSTQRQLLEANSSLSALRARLEEQTGARTAAAHMASVLKDQLVSSQAEILAYKRELASLQREKKSTPPESVGPSDAFASGILHNALTLSPTDTAAVTGTQAALLQALENDRTLLTNKVVALTAQVEELRGYERRVAELQQQLADVRAQQAVTLELLGEREEELEATKSELEEVKEMFRVQLDALMHQVVGAEPAANGITT